ncbi:MAG: gluconeogenesis factor YvcK family protein [Patescibacteria group bacterium]
MKIKHIVTIGGGTGTFVVLSGLKKYPVNLSAVVSMADDGGSTGVLRDEYGVLPPGDIRRALVALSESSETLRDLFTYRFEDGGLQGHNFGNLFLSTLEKVTGDFTSAVREASTLLSINGEVVPVTLDNVRLHARLVNGKVIKGQTRIDIPKDLNRAKIESVWLEPQGRINPSARRVIHSADLIIIGPGDLYGSVIPNLLVRGVPEAIKSSKAKKIYIGNTMTKHGETNDFKAEDFLKEIEKYLGEGVLDYALFNKKKPQPALAARYRKEGAHYVDISNLDLKSKKPKILTADLIDTGKLVRHSPKKLAETLLALFSQR